MYEIETFHICLIYMGTYGSMYGAYMAPYMSHTLPIYGPYNSGIYSDIYVSGHWSHIWLTIYEIETFHIF